ncbi:phage tail tape measure protein [Campylobacter ureolyticus]|uniref:phage tail tape measure protein n=1 Tax=Campylobacter ureolyticus TaxID=827 RepID=UPI00036957D1|nr:phage tail tape measure protein [Campylobacter ureolyticus]MCR8685201.1 phage tail tape measure protein [Campylobacter ureolyticus]QQY35300.1 phage tail tape measure protein [Campylobacter ureolyticus]SUX22280.1 TP901 family tail tape measure protein [Campylobacter ureolyticus]
MAKATLTFGMDLSEFNTAFNKINRQTSNLSQSLGRGLQDAMSSYKNGLSDLKLGFKNDKTLAQLDELKHKIKATTKAKLDLDISEAKNKLKGLVGNILATIGAVKGMAAPISSAIGFEESMADVRKVVDFDSKEELTSFGNEIKKLSREIPMSMNELAAITASGGQLGIAKKDLLEFTEVASKMGVAFDITASEAGDSMGKLMDIFNTDIKGVTKLGDAINYLSDNSASKAAEVVEVLKRIGGASQAVGITSQQAAALSAAFLSLGKTPELAATSSRTLLLQLKNISSATPKAKKALKSLGIGVGELEKAMSKNPQEAILKFLQTVKTMPNKNKQLEVLTDIFGRGFSSDIALLVNGLDTYKDTLKNVANETDYLGSMTKEFKNKSDTTANNLQLLKNSFYEIGVNIGSVFLPFLNKAVNFIKEITSKIADFAIKFPNLIIAFGSVAGGLATLNAGFLIFKVVGSATTIVLNSFRISLLALPLTIKTTSSGILKLTTCFTTLKLQSALALGGIKTVMKGIATSIITGLKAGLEPTITAFKNGFGGIFEALRSAKDILVSFFSLFSRGQKAKDELNGIKEAGVDFGTSFGKALSILLYPLEALSNIFNAIGLIIDIIALKGANFAEGFTNSIKNMCEDIKAFFKPLFDFIWQDLTA